MTINTVITDMDAMGARKAAELEKRCFSGGINPDYHRPGHR